MAKEYAEIKLSGAHDGDPINALIVDVVVQGGRVTGYTVIDMATSQPLDAAIEQAYRDALDSAAQEGYAERLGMEG